MKPGDRSKSGRNRVVRGGSWINNGRNLRSAYRNRNAPDNRNDNLGFRLAPAQGAAGVRAIDQIVILPWPLLLNRPGENKGPRCVSSRTGDFMKAHRRAAFFLDRHA